MTENLTVTNDIKTLSDELISWLIEQALPVWYSEGTRPDIGDCFETISLEDIKGVRADRRARIVPRQIYSFLVGAELGWNGPAKNIASALWTWFENTYKTPEGHFANAVGMDGRISDSGFDLYNHAFALFGLATIKRTVPDLAEASETKAKRLLDFLIRTYRHPGAGFREANPDKIPLRSNPHMHLFEALLAWEAISDDPVWSDLADEIAELALAHFIDPVSGGLREFFDIDWSPMPDDSGRVMEPGHQFEWAWLLVKWGQSRKDADALIAARRLYDIGRTFGIDESRGAAFMSLNDDFAVRDPVARLWGQTEWIKAGVALASISTGVERDAYLADIPTSVNALTAYFKNVPQGLYTDKWSADGTFKAEPAPASSLYHIVCAISELNAFAKTL
ncbi:MAG: AGE family epimerase/isomerase [Roseibium sp.]